MLNTVAHSGERGMEMVDARQVVETSHSGNRMHPSLVSWQRL